MTTSATDIASAHGWEIPDHPLNRLMAIEEIKQLKARYFRLLDSKQWEDWRGVFTDDMRFYLGDGSDPVTQSGDEFVAHVSSVLNATRTIHQGHMPEIELTSDLTGKGVWAMFDWVDFNDHPDRTLQGYGHYIEDYEKSADGNWRIKNLRLTRIRVDTPSQAWTPRL